MAEDRKQDSQDPTSRRHFLTGAVTLGTTVSSLEFAGSAMGAEQTKGEQKMNPRLYSFVGGKTGTWSVLSATAVIGEALPTVERVNMVHGVVEPLPDGAKWMLRGVTSNERYATRPEKESMVQKQAALGRKTSTHAALIPIRKNAKWWALTQDERRAIFEERSKHVTIGIKYLPAIARRLHHCRDLSETEPFDFITLFDYAKSDSNAFDDMLAELRAGEEWKYVDREVDIRLVRAD